MTTVLLACSRVRARPASISVTAQLPIANRIGRQINGAQNGAGQNDLASNIRCGPLVAVIREPGLLAHHPTHLWHNTMPSPQSSPLSYSI